MRDAPNEVMPTPFSTGFGPIWGWFSLCDLLLADGLTLVTEFIGMIAALAIFGKSKFRPLSMPLSRESERPLPSTCDLDQQTLTANSLFNYAPSST